MYVQQKTTTHNFAPNDLCLVVKLSGLLPLEPIVLSLSPVVDKVGEQEGRYNVQEAGLEPPDGVRDALRDDAGESALLERGNLVPGDNVITNLGDLDRFSAKEIVMKIIATIRIFVEE
jgi:hypothetical protein